MEHPFLKRALNVPSLRGSSPTESCNASLSLNILVSCLPICLTHQHPSANFTLHLQWIVYSFFLPLKRIHGASLKQHIHIPSNCYSTNSWELPGQPFSHATVLAVLGGSSSWNSVRSTPYRTLAKAFLFAPHPHKPPMCLHLSHTKRQNRVFSCDHT